MRWKVLGEILRHDHSPLCISGMAWICQRFCFAGRALSGCLSLSPSDAAPTSRGEVTGGRKYCIAHSVRLLSRTIEVYLIHAAHAAAALPKVAGHALGQAKGPPVVQSSEPNCHLDLQGKTICGWRWLRMTARLAQSGHGLCYGHSTCIEADLAILRDNPVCV